MQRAVGLRPKAKGTRLRHGAYGMKEIADLRFQIAECELGIMGFWLKADG
jgi:hypothetical protein